VNTDLPPAKRVVVIAPHPDDESLGCGGTIARFAKNGAEVRLLVVSDGAAIEEPDGRHEDIVAVRTQELEAATKILGIQHLRTLQLPDGRLTHHEAQIHTALSDYLTTVQPDLVLAPSLIDGHQDHVIVGRIALQLLRTTPGWTLAFYEVLAPLRFNTLVDITDVASIKETAIRCYQRSLFQQPQLFWDAFRALNVAKSAFVHHSGLFEAFWVLHAPPSDHEIIAWATYGFQPSHNGQGPLQRVKDVDDLVFAVQEKMQQLANTDQQIHTLRSELTAATQKLQHQETLIAALQLASNKSATPAQDSRAECLTKETSLFRQCLEYVFPPGSSRRSALSVVKRRLTQYTSKSPNE